MVKNSKGIFPLHWPCSHFPILILEYWYWWISSQKMHNLAPELSPHQLQFHEMPDFCTDSFQKWNWHCFSALYETSNQHRWYHLRHLCGVWKDLVAMLIPFPRESVLVVLRFKGSGLRGLLCGFLCYLLEDSSQWWWIFFSSDIHCHGQMLGVLQEESLPLNSLNVFE